MIIHAWLRTRYHFHDTADYDWYECSWRKPAELWFVVFFLEVMHCTRTINSSQMRSVSSSLSVEASTIWLPCQGLRSAQNTFSHPFFKVSAEYSLAEHDHQKLTGSTSLTALVVFGLCNDNRRNLTRQADIKIYNTSVFSTQPLPLSWTPLASQNSQRLQLFIRGLP